MSSCPTRHTLDEFLNEVLDNVRAAEISRHIDECLTCRDQCEQLTLANFETLSQVENSSDSVTIRKLVEKLAHFRPVADDENSFANQPVSFPIPGDSEAPLGRIQTYRIIDQIGAGSQGKLFRAFDESLRRVVAIKVLHQRLAQTDDGNVRITREARAAAALRDDNIVQVYQIGNEPDFPPFIVMEFVEGESLTDRIGRTPPIPFREAVEMVRGAALGLQAAHNSGIIHRDIKPSNILLDRQSGRVKLTDFGLALEEADANRVTAEGTISGTPAYMSPEQITRPETVGARSDLYSLGVVFYELLTGEVPFRGVVQMTLMQVVHDEPLAPRRFNDRIPKDLETICLKAMSKQSAARFASATEMVAELDRWLTGQPIRSRPVTRMERSWRWCKSTCGR